MKSSTVDLVNVKPVYVRERSHKADFMIPSSPVRHVQAYSPEDQYFI